MRPEGVDEALDVAARQRRGGLAGRAHERRVADEDLVRAARGGRATAGRAARSPSDQAPSDPSISYWSEFFRPALIWLMLTAPRAPFSKRSRIDGRVLGRRSSRLDRVGGSLGRERLDRPGRLAGGSAMNVGEVGHDRSRSCWPVTNVIRSSQCEPMSPTARSAPPWSGCEPPVPVGLEQQPVLEVAAGHEPDVAEARRRATSSRACWLSG